MPGRYTSPKLRAHLVENSGLSPEIVNSVLDAYDSQVRQLVEAGYWVWVADLGWLVKVVKKGKRGKHPRTGVPYAGSDKLDVVLKRTASDKRKRPRVEEPIRDS